MKLNKIVSAAIVAGAILGSTVAVSAAENAITVLNPIDLSTGKSVESLKEGDVIAVPVDADSETGKLTSLGIVLKYDSDYLTPGAKYSKRTDIGKNMLALADDNTSALIFNSDSTVVQYIKGIYVYNDALEENNYVGNYVVNTAYTISDSSATCVMAGWTSDASIAVTDDPEAYFIFTVNKDVSNDALNFGIVSGADDTQVVVSDTLQNLGNTRVSIADDNAKLNACAGAVKLDVDATKLNKWVQALYVQVDDGAVNSIEQYVENEDGTYSFPVRIISANGGEHTVTFYADLSASEIGDVTDEKVKVGSTTITLDSPSSYTSATYTAE